MVPVLKVFVRVLDHHYCRIHHRSNRNGDTAERHDVRVDALIVHHDKRRQNPQRQRHDGHERRAQVKQKNKTHHGHHQKLFEKLKAQVFNGALDQPGAVVHGHDLNALRQPRLQLAQFRFDGGDGFKCVLARAHNDHAPRCFAFAVELANATAHFWPDLNARHVAQAHRDASIVGQQRHFAKVVQRLQITRRTHHVFRFTQFKH